MREDLSYSCTHSREELSTYEAKKGARVRYDGYGRFWSGPWASTIGGPIKLYHYSIAEGTKVLLGLDEDLKRSLAIYNEASGFSLLYNNHRPRNEKLSLREARHQFPRGFTVLSVPQKRTTTIRAN